MNSPCCAQSLIREYIHLWENGFPKGIFGHVGVCPKCRKAAREPKLWSNTPGGFRELWPILRKIEARNYAYDVELKDGVLVPCGAGVEETKAALKALAQDDRDEDWREETGY